MIIHDFYVIGITIDPSNAYPPLVVNPDAVLPCPVAAELLQPVRWRNTKIIHCDRVVEHAQLAVADLLDVLWQAVSLLLKDLIMSSDVLYNVLR
jgi:hypothetical protein